MPKGKLFWVGMLILVIMVPFIIIWIMAGLGWAIGMLVMLTILVLLTLGGTRRRRKRYTIIDEIDEDEYDEEIIVGRPRRPHIPPVVPINPKGARFIIGDSKSFRKREQDAMRRIKKNLWG